MTPAPPSRPDAPAGRAATGGADASDTGGTDTDGTDGDALLVALEGLRSDAATLSLPLALPDVRTGREQREALVHQLDDYLLPRLRRLDAPLLAVVGGSTGAGKSTLVNSLLRVPVSRSGVLRPTTRSPVLVHHPDDAAWFDGDRVLPSLARVTGVAGDRAGGASGGDGGAGGQRITTVRLASAAGLPAGLALLDAPDIDSVVEANRELAAQLLGAADLWLFVTTAARYADAVPWDLLRTAVERGTSVAVVLDRVPPQHLVEVRSDLARMLRDGGLAGAPVFTVDETHPVDGMLPVETVAPLHGWLTSLASDARSRQAVVRRTLAGAVASLRARVPALAAAADAQAGEQATLRAVLDEAWRAADRQLERGLTDGSLLRGEVLARWQEFVGTGDLFRGLESAVGRLRDRAVALVRGRRPPAEPLGEALQTGVAALVRAQAEDAVEASVAAWRERPAGADLLASVPEHDLALAPDFDDRLERMVRDWQRAVLELVRTEGQGRRSQARVLSLGVNALGVVLMVVVFASTAFIPTGAEVGVGAGTAVVGQKLLEAVFGDQAVRALAARARADLVDRVEQLVAAERARLEALLVAAGVDPDAGARLRSRGAEVEVEAAAGAGR